MLNPKSLLWLSLSTLALSACATVPAPPPPAATAPLPWAFARSDVPVDPDYRFGTLPNGMRYVIRQNTTPKGTALVRMRIEAGSVDEADNERGFAHFIEHMAFNGSRRVPEGEMIKLLERSGLAFGADTNAETGLVHTMYKLDLPRNDPALLETALMLMRETASELTITPEAVDRERGIMQAELRDRSGFALRNAVDAVGFVYPGSRLSHRMVVGGTSESLAAATADQLRMFWRREYVPRHTTLMVIGDFDPAAVEARIKAEFADWQPAPAEPPPSVGPVDPHRKGQTTLFIDPALSEQITASRSGKLPDEPDSLAQRRENQLRRIGYAIINRRLQRRMLEADPPFRSAGFGTEDVFKASRTTNLLINTVDGKWRRGLIEAASEYRRALQFGFTEAEVAEQVANIRTAAENAVAGADTRSNGTLVGSILALLADDIVPDTPANSLNRLEAFLPQITPAAVLAALKREVVPLDDPLLRFVGRTAPEGGAAAVRKAWNDAARAPITAPAAQVAGSFGYTAFGPPGSVTSDKTEPALGIRQIRFANGVMLNLKRTDLQRDRVMVRVSIDGGEMLQTRENPRATDLAAMLPAGGLGKHSADELQTLLAGKTVRTTFSSEAERFVSDTTTTPRDLELQLQAITAMITDPGLRPEGEVLFRQAMNNFFSARRATPGSVLGTESGGILSDGDPRFTLGKAEDYRALTFARLKADIGDRLAKGAIEVALVGDFDEAQAIDLIGKTLGSLPQREPAFQPYRAERQRRFTADRSARVLRHAGPKDQALLFHTWPTRDGEDPVEASQIDLLDRVTQLTLTDTLREKLGKTYSPNASSSQSRVWPGYGTFSVTASTDVNDVPAMRAAIEEAIATLRDQPVSADLLQRAREPLLQSLANRLKSNAGWMVFVAESQSKTDQIDRYLQAPKLIAAITPAQLQAIARRYLTASGGVEITVLPDGVDPSPAQATVSR